MLPAGFIDRHLIQSKPLTREEEKPVETPANTKSTKSELD